MDPPVPGSVTCVSRGQLSDLCFMRVEEMEDLKRRLLDSMYLVLSCYECLIIFLLTGIAISESNQDKLKSDWRFARGSHVGCKELG